MVKDLDPAVDRVIRRCLEEDPKRRPPSAINVAAALSGGDLVAAALAAGEMPTPEMIAASSEKEGFSCATAGWCFAGVIAAMVLAAFYGKTLRSEPRRLDVPPEALAYRAREMLKRLGYTEDPARTAYGFDAWDRDYLRAAGPSRQGHLGFDSQGGPARGGRLLVPAASQRVLGGFVSSRARNRQRRDQLRFASKHRAWDDPDVSGSRGEDCCNWRFGRLRGKRVRVGQSRRRGPIGGSSSAEADLDPGRFKPVAPTSAPPVAADVQLAWTGTFAQAPEDTVRVDAAWRQGKPVFFDIRGSGDVDRSSTPRRRPPRQGRHR